MRFTSSSLAIFVALLAPSILAVPSDLEIRHKDPCPAGTRVEHRWFKQMIYSSLDECNMDTNCWPDFTTIANNCVAIANNQAACCKPGHI